MLSRILKDRIQKKYGHKIKYPKDCCGLSEHIRSVCKCYISPSTLKRLFGFVEGTETLRPTTKDAIANYLNFESWIQLQDNLIGRKVSRKPVVERLNTSDVETGQVIRVAFGRMSFVKMLAVSKKRFLVLEQCKTRVDLEDELEFSEIKLDYPLLVTLIKRSGTKVKDIVLGELTGVTEIELLNKIKQDERIKYNSLATK